MDRMATRAMPPLLMAAGILLVASLSPAQRGLAEERQKTGAGSTVATEGRLPRLPSGPPGAGRFGAYYTRLRYTNPWEHPWRVGDSADVLVRFEDGGHRLVFWRGTSYIPCWVTDSGVWYTNEFCETSGGGTKGCAEPMSDKQARYSHVRVLESTDARVVVHWRYALADVQYRIAHPDAKTGWGDWADEYYTVYPDAVSVRKIVLWTSRLDVWHEFQEAIVINPPGKGPEDNLETAAVSIANLDGRSADYVWTKPGEPHLTGQVPGACIEVVNLKASKRPFMIIDPQEASISTFNGHAPNSRFNCWDHWPVSQDKSWTRVAASYDRPSHTSLSWIARPREPLPKDWKAHARTEQSVTKLLLNGLTDRRASALAPLAKSWLRPAALKIRSPGFVGGQYDPADRAYHVRRTEGRGPSSLELEFDASEGSPLVSPAVVVGNWGEANVRAAIVGGPDRGEIQSRSGHVHRLDGVDLVVWMQIESAVPVRIRWQPVR